MSFLRGRSFSWFLCLQDLYAKSGPASISRCFVLAHPPCSWPISSHISCSSAECAPLCCEGFIRHRSPGPHPRICLAPSHSQGSIWHRNRVKSGNRCQINVESMSNQCLIDLRGVEGKADSRVGSRASLPNKPLTTLDNISHRGLQCMHGNFFRNSVFRVLLRHTRRPRVRDIRGENLGF